MAKPIRMAWWGFIGCFRLLGGGCVYRLVGGHSKIPDWDIEHHVLLHVVEDTVPPHVIIRFPQYVPVLVWTKRPAAYDAPIEDECNPTDELVHIWKPVLCYRVNLQLFAFYLLPNE